MIFKYQLLILLRSLSCICPMYRGYVMPNVFVNIIPIYLTNNFGFCYIILTISMNRTSQPLV